MYDYNLHLIFKRIISICLKKTNKTGKRRRSRRSKALQLIQEQNIIYYKWNGLILPLSKGSFSIGYVVVVFAIIPNVATIATTPKIAIVVVLLLNWIITFTTRQDKDTIL